MATIDQLLPVLTLVAALGCGLIAGVFFAFSTFVMRALARLSPSEGIAAMQSINITVLNPWFLSAFFGTAAACLLALVASLLRWYKPEAVCLLIASALYLVGTVLVTIVCNVPKNEAQASVVPADPDGASLWAGYVASLDSLEPRSDGSVACRSGIVQHRTRLLSSAFVTLRIKRKGR